MIEEFLEEVKADDKFGYLMWDYDISLLNHESHDQTANSVDMLYSYAFAPLVNRPNRVTSLSA